MNSVLCEPCIARLDARSRWEECCIGGGKCDACKAVHVPNKGRYPYRNNLPFPLFKVAPEDLNPTQHREQDMP